MPYSAGASLTARSPDAITSAAFARSRSVSLAPAGTTSDCCVNDTIPQPGSRHTSRRLRHHSSVR
jgi:hypothetical protein